MALGRGRRKVPLPAISPQAVTRYLTRPLDNHDWLKDAPIEDLRAHVKDLGYRFATDPWQHQLVCFMLAQAFEQFAFFLKMGGGKSKIFLDQVRYRKRRGELQRAVALAPQLVHLASWEDQIREHAPDVNYAIVDSDNAASRTRMVEGKADLLVMTYAGLRSYMVKRVFNEKRGKNEEVVDKSIAGDFAARFNMLGMDESHKFLGNMESLFWQCCWWLSHGSQYRYLFSGTAFGRDPLPLHAQMMLVDHGATFGTTVGGFRNAFYKAKQSYWAGIEWTYDRSTEDELRQMLKHRSISYEIEELHDMPARIPIRIPVRLRGDGLAYYQRIVRGLREARGDYRSLDSTFTRMRQCCSGFIAMKSDDESRIEVQFKDNAKLDLLEQLLLSKDDKFLIFHVFRPSGPIIERMLAAHKIGFAAMRGGTANPGAQYQKFLNDPKCRAFVLNTAVGAEAINPQYVCRRAVFYESPTDPKQRAQAEGRVWRPGQKWPTFIYDLLCKGTVEEKIYRYNREGADLLRAVMSGEDDLLVDAPPEQGNLFA